MDKDKDKEPKDVVVNLFKDNNEKFMQLSEAQRIPRDNFNKIVTDHLDVIKKDAKDLNATGIITVLLDDSGPIVDYFAGSVNLNAAYVLMDQLKGVILEKIEQAQEGKE
tara:strand:- start:198 stop:524 length:327 start_codon:yes stop_codon:yes gene_type:complete